MAARRFAARPAARPHARRLRVRAWQQEAALDLISLKVLTACVINASRYYVGVLRSFKDRDTEAIWHRQRSRLLDGPTQRVAWRKLAVLDAAETLADLRVPPGNRLEKLRGDREGQHSIRINQQWRICFSWSDAGPEDVEIVDYH
jgi:toxin HigB-1